MNREPYFFVREPCLLSIEFGENVPSAVPEEFVKNYGRWVVNRE